MNLRCSGNRLRENDKNSSKRSAVGISGAQMKCRFSRGPRGNLNRMKWMSSLVMILGKWLQFTTVFQASAFA